MARTRSAMPGGGWRPHPWHRWLNGEVWELTEGEDFTTVAAFRSQVYRQAAVRGLKVSVQIRGGLLYLQARRPAGAQLEPEPEAGEYCTPSQLVDELKLGRSRAVMVLIRSGELPAQRPPGGGPWRIPVDAVTDDIRKRILEIDAAPA